MRGWAKVGTSTKYHYFEIEEGYHGGRSLCGKWTVLRTRQEWLADEMHEHSENCKPCIRKLRKKHPEFFEEP